MESNLVPSGERGRRLISHRLRTEATAWEAREIARQVNGVVDARLEKQNDQAAGCMRRGQGNMPNHHS